MISDFLAQTVDFVWGIYFVWFLLLGGFVLLVMSRFLPLKGFVHAIKLVTGKFHHTEDEKAEGQITHFQALSNALAATIGLGNISGVAVAITQGGPGAVFWMWVAALIGMNTKFFECTLSMLYRGHDYRGEVQGGPMYVIQNAMPKAFFPLAIMFAVCGLIGTQAMFQTNQVAVFVGQQYNVSSQWVGIVSALSVAYILFGGLKRIANFTSRMVPSMCLLYIACSLIIIFTNIEFVIPVLKSIFEHAFTGEAAVGGAAGVAVREVMKIGVKRAAFSNEAGMGTAPMAHGNAKTSEPISEGLVASIGPFIDTIVVCTMTAIVILVSGMAENAEGVEGIALTTRAFQSGLGAWGVHALGLAILMFSASTMVGMANYNQKCWDFLFRGRGIFKYRLSFVIFFCFMLYLGAVSDLPDVINLLDIGFALMALPNMLATIYLSKKVVIKLREYFNKYAI